MTKIVDLRGDSRILGPSNPNRSVAGITKIARHHSATATGDVWAFQNHWRGTLGWGTGGYHEIILRDGSVQLVYRDNVTTNGVGNHNSKTYHICVVGNGSFTAEQEKAFDERARAAMQRFNLKASDVLGHNEFSGHGSNTCPGINMATVRSRLSGSSGSTPTPSPAPTPTYNVEPWNKRQTVSTDVLNVRAAQNTNSAIIKTLKRGQTFNATRITRNGESVNGFTTWFEVDGAGWVSGALVTEVSSNNTASAATPANVWHSRSGTVTVTAAKGINLRGTSSGDTTTPTNLGVLALLGRGQQVKYDRLLVQRNGHAFVRQPRVDGYGWLTIGPTKNGKVIGYWTSGISI
ncbi:MULTISPECIES: N-acetylmuramoyl-L-alanine amidase [unclassified Enterococcus]|uniref:N-acetylmuramoyl-L-alanine amidase n=1 Tax=unclassified Enterococcus TaxID=2608891 RepID=UPI001903CFFB|nr:MULTISPECIES: N-acetylmuramoyl-L-alanine amidase [unclassified Enterococcus]MBK0038316.1 N-acetylmuramoyl-L-alanine amidase [Enterococcus sp. S52]MBK0070948.1 N-acetylmuramoyl-L-alanine amidase [Enterococcus sp. S53]MBK0141473.1 N-acetylmuramoyl-L-alanine amidase [Enterococcus sp. S76]MBK0144952.1 N-acetylmuramoyl-L-alanine amidase [Enterococcus sp. S77]